MDGSEVGVMVVDYGFADACRVGLCIVELSFTHHVWDALVVGCKEVSGCTVQVGFALWLFERLVSVPQIVPCKV